MYVDFLNTENTECPCIRCFCDMSDSESMPGNGK